jgi:hypothetical protein
MEVQMNQQDFQQQLKPAEPLVEKVRTKPVRQERPNGTLGFVGTPSSSFDAILDAYEKDPERWDGLE